MSRIPPVIEGNPELKNNTQFTVKSVIAKYENNFSGVNIKNGCLGYPSPVPSPHKILASLNLI